MLTYWDLDEKERSALNRDDVARYIDTELMCKGVLRVKAPETVSVPEAKLQTRSYYTFTTGSYYSSNLAFDTAEDAAAALALCKGVVMSEYIESEAIQYVNPLTDPKVDVAQLPTSDEFESRKRQVKEAAAAKSTNKKAQEEYAKAVKAQDEALAGLWEDWHRCREQAAAMRKVASVFEDYTRTAGDAETAAKFLRKVFSEDEIRNASEWCGLSIPNGDEAAA